MDRHPARRGVPLSTLNVRMLPDGHLAVKAYGRPVAGGRGAYVSFPVPDDPAGCARRIGCRPRRADLGRAPRPALTTHHLRPPTARRRPPTEATSHTGE